MTADYHALRVLLPERDALERELRAVLDGELRQVTNRARSGIAESSLGHICTCNRANATVRQEPA